MAILTWPINLPQVPQKGYQESFGVNIVRSQTDAGPAKQRRRSRKPNELTVSFILTTAQSQTLETFIKDEIMGVSRFIFPHPRLNTPVEVRVVPQGSGEFVQLQYIAPGYWNANLKLEILS